MDYKQRSEFWDKLLALEGKDITASMWNAQRKNFWLTVLRLQRGVIE